MAWPTLVLGSCPASLSFLQGDGSIRGQACRPEPPCDLTVSCSLDLDAWINEPLSDSESEDEKPKAIFQDEEQRHAKQRPPEADEQELARVSAQSRLGYVPLSCASTEPTFDMGLDFVEVRVVSQARPSPGRVVGPDLTQDLWCPGMLPHQASSLLLPLPQALSLSG